MPRYSCAFIAAALLATAVQAQGVLVELKWVDGGMSATRGGVLRCDPGQDFQLSLEGEDASMQRVPLGMYAPEVVSSDPAVARAVVSSSSAHVVNVRCTGDGEAWLTAETMGKLAHFGVLVGSSKGQAGMGQPRPGTATMQGSYASTSQATAIQSGKLVQAPLRKPASIARAVEEGATAQTNVGVPETLAKNAKLMEAVRGESVTFRFLDGGQLGGAGIGVAAYRVGVAPNHVRLGAKSTVALSVDEQGVPPGSYQVRFAITRAMVGGSLKVKANSVENSCSIQTQDSSGGTVQFCDSGTMEVLEDGKFHVVLEVANKLTPPLWEVGNITVTRMGITR